MFFSLATREPMSPKAGSETGGFTGIFAASVAFFFPSANFASSSLAFALVSFKTLCICSGVSAVCVLKALKGNALISL